MQIIAGYKSIETQTPRAFAVCIGIFDGVHLGHQALLRKTMELAHQEHLAALVYTFHPHPAKALRPERAPQLIESLAQRLAHFATLGIDTVVVEPFDLAYAAITAEAFVRDILVHRLQARHVVVGDGFTFGYKQQGSVATLTALGQQVGFAAHPVAHVCIDGAPVSSTRIRAAVRDGDVSGAQHLLGHAMRISGAVTHGARRGITLGYPTANVEPTNELLPALGVYAAWAHGVFGQMPAVVNVGVAPTFAGTHGVRVEAHLLGYSGADFYATDMALDFVQRLRAERRFESLDALKAQIKDDAAAAAAILS